MEPKIFGVQHIIYLVVTIILTIVGLVVIKKKVKSEKAKNILIRVCGAVLFLTVLINRIFCEIFWPGEFLPTSVCGILAFVLGFCMIFCKKDSVVFQFLVPTILVSATISCIYPNYISQGLSFVAKDGVPAIVHKYTTIFCPPTITSLLHHSMQVFCTIMLVMIGWHKPTMKRWSSWILGYCCLITFGLFLIKVVNKSNAVLINSPIVSGTIFNWFWCGVIFLALYTIVLLIVDTVQNKNNGFIATTFNRLKNIFTKQNRKSDENK